MANAAAKKAAKASNEISNKYLPYIIISNILYILIRLYYNYITTTIWSYIFLFIYILIYIITQYGLIYSVQNNISNEIYFDSFCVNFLSQIIASFSDKGRLILLLIPGYFIYIGVGWYLEYKKNKPKVTEDIVDNNNNNNSEQKQEKKVKTKVIRR